jgi:hypothetical protein
MATTDLRLEEPGSLIKPGPVGRFVRLAFAAACLYYVWSLIDATASLFDSDGHIRSIFWNGVIFGLFLVSYVINIGYSRSWKKWPAMVSAFILICIAGFGFVNSGNPETTILAWTICGWELYVFTHLGTAFLIAGLIGTPGCEMRAFHDLFSRITGIATKEHVCPVGPLNRIDRWEARRA